MRGASRDGTFGALLDRHRGEGPGFAILRLLLAVAILWIHARYLSRLGVSAPSPDGAGTAAAPKLFAVWTGPSRVFFLFLVPAFFALSGFLVTGSGLRLRATSTFLAFRVLRILPALLVEVTLSALVLGPIFTNLPLKSYFTDPQFGRYFGNIVGWITFYLPGVFENNHVPVVNGNLWTLPSEFDCYLITAALMVTGLAYQRMVLTIIMAAITLVVLGLNTFTDFAVTPEQFASHTITYYFFIGMMFYHWREYIPARWWLFGLSIIGTYVFLSFSHTIYLAPVFVTYCIVFLGVKGLPEFQWLRTRDYSYGIYLYGYPIIQALIASFPVLRGNGVLTFVVGTTSTIVFAAFSWHVIERRPLMFKNRLPKRLFPAAARPPAVATAPVDLTPETPPLTTGIRRN
jgi:peptidoglycan/LPS O-acetylase OafA/YrhL